MVKVAYTCLEKSVFRNGTDWDGKAKALKIFSPFNALMNKVCGGQHFGNLWNPNIKMVAKPHGASENLLT